MKFKNTELLPGVVVNVNDPKKLGRIKVTVPGLFDASQMSIEGMPWVYPITMTGYQGFSKLMEGSKVWVFKQEGNYKEFWYMPMFEANENTREILSEYSEPEVLISRSAGDRSVYIYYTDQQGIVLKVGDATVNVGSDGNIVAKSEGGQVTIKGGKVYIGSEDGHEPAVLGNSLNNVLSQLVKDIMNVASIASSSAPQFTGHLSTPLLEMASHLNSGIGKNILCDNTLVV